MAVNVTYIFGAGASANALPVVKNLAERFKIFCDHFLDYIKTISPVHNYQEVETKLNELIKNLNTHYTIDTYAKKLYLKNPNLHTNKEYVLLIKCLSAYFLYEQLPINSELECNKYINTSLSPYRNDRVSEFDTNVSKIKKDFDYRYDSFLASILKHDMQNELVIPNNINFISWNYDFQLEKAFMNFSEGSLADAMIRLNVIGTPQETFTRDASYSHLIKLNGTGGFLTENSFNKLFDFSKDELDHQSFEMFKDILTADRSVYKNGIRFSWEKNKFSNTAIDLASEKIKKSDIIIIIGYSFPYFNREIDKKVFTPLESKHPNSYKFYIQAPDSDITSIAKRFDGVWPNANVEFFTELDQFLIPNEMSL